MSYRNNIEKIVREPENNIIKVFLYSSNILLAQVTDMHLHHVLPGSKEFEDLRMYNKLLKDIGPDLIINTGDMFCWNAYFLVKRVLKKFDSYFGSVAPWAYAWGNHDNENYKQGGLEKMDRIEELMANLPNNVYLASRRFIENVDKTLPEKGSYEYEAIAPRLKGKLWRYSRFDGFYGGNYAIELYTDKNSDKTRPNIVLFILNSRSNHHIPPNARKWMVNYLDSFGSDKPPSFLFYHVPNREFNEIWDGGHAVGFKLENVCTERGDSKVHEFIKSLGCVKGCFVGHDHINDYYGELDGVYYAYGRKTCRSGYGVDRGLENDHDSKTRKVVDGVKLIQIDVEKSKWSFKSVLIDGRETLFTGELDL